MSGLLPGPDLGSGEVGFDALPAAGAADVHVGVPQPTATPAPKAPRPASTFRLLIFVASWLSMLSRTASTGPGYIGADRVAAHQPQRPRSRRTA